MLNRRQFIIYEAVPLPDGRIDKVPLNWSGKKHSAHDPAIWTDLTTAKALADHYGARHGVGFVFTATDPYFFIDIDRCLDDSGQWSEKAVELCQRFAGCAVEISVSGKGLHIFGTGVVMPGIKCDAEGFSLYREGRFAALTFNGWHGDPDHNAQQALDALVRDYFTVDPVFTEEWTTGPTAEWSGPTDDQELITKMLRSKSTSSAFGKAAPITALWMADAAVLGQYYPDDHGARPFDHSSADAALCSHLAFWTGKDCQRMDRMFKASGLMREKWAKREDYCKRTILRAVSGCKKVYNMPSTPTAPVSTGYRFMSVDKQQEHFAGCVYVRDIHRVFVPDGALLKPEQFKATYGGYVFALDGINDKVTKSAWEVFTESQATQFPKATGCCFRPEHLPGSIIQEGGISLVNTYVPINTPRQKGDASRFINHIKLLLPDERDQQILLAYCAAIVQYPGVKFQWCVLLQGCEGNGKTLMINCIAEAIGWKYSHMPNAADLTNKFNAWMMGKLFIGVEEVYTQEKQEVHETLKRFVTNSRIEIQAKGTDQYTGDNRANSIMCSNHKDGIRKSRLDRRFCIFFTAQQKPGDIARSGMSGNYFPDLYNWLRAGGYAIVNDFLRTYKIPDEFNPAGTCHRAPETSSTREAVSVSMGVVEQEISEAVDSAIYGFRGGWLSSMAVTKLLGNRKIGKRKIREIIEELGYIEHPALDAGRSTMDMPIEGGKPRLYVKSDSPAALITDRGSVVPAYIKAQAENNS